MFVSQYKEQFIPCEFALGLAARIRPNGEFIIHPAGFGRWANPTCIGEGFEACVLQKMP